MSLNSSTAGSLPGRRFMPETQEISRTGSIQKRMPGAPDQPALPVDRPCALLSEKIRRWASFE